MKTCPFCSRRRGLYIGSHITRRQGRCERFICGSCKRKWFTSERSFFGDNQAAYKSRISEEEIIQACALLTLGLPWRLIEQLLEIKAASLRKTIQKCMEISPGRRKLEIQVHSKFALPYKEITERFEHLEGVYRGLVDPRERARDYFKIMRERGQRHRRKLERRLCKILKFPVRLSVYGDLDLSPPAGNLKVENWLPINPSQPQGT